MAKKTWIEKLNCERTFKIKTLDKQFTDIPEGSEMLVVSPPIVDEYIRKIKKGQESDIKKMREDLAREYGADKTCPVSTGIFLRIVSEANFEKRSQGTAVSKLTPFWRIIPPGAPITKKLSFGTDFVFEQRKSEGLSYIG